CKTRCSPRAGGKFVVVADDAIDLRHLGKRRRIGLRRATGDDDARIRARARLCPDRLPGLAHRFGRNRAGGHHNSFFNASRGRLGADYPRLVGIEPASKCENVDAHAAPCLADRSGSNRPSNSYSTGPVINTCPSLSRHSIKRSPPGNVTVTLRPTRRVRAAATATAQAAEPQALVRPAPRSQVRTSTLDVDVTTASEILARSG